MLRYIGVFMIGIIMFGGCSLANQKLASPESLMQVHANPYPNPIWPDAVFFSLPAVTIERDERPPVIFDPILPFTLVFSRGSGQSGVGTVTILADGYVGLRRQILQDFQLREEIGALQLQQDDLHDLLMYLNNSVLLGMHKSYSAGGYDGLQWSLQIQQERQMKSLSFDNHFPQAIIEFSEMIDQLLIQHGLLDVVWKPIPQSEKSDSPADNDEKP